MSVIDGTILLAIGLGVAVIAIARRLKADNRALQAEIAERKLSEQALRESDEKFHQLAENITDAFWIRSPDMREVHFVSPAYERIWGRPRKIHLTQPEKWTEAVHPEDREQVLATFKALTSDTRNVDLEYRILRPDGEVRWVHARGFQVRNAADQLVRLTGIVSDITERKKVEQALRLSEQEQRRLAERLELERMRLAEAQSLARVGSWELDHAANLLTWSDENYRIFGLDRNKIAASRDLFLTLVHPDDRDTVSNAYNQSVRNHLPYSIEHRIQLNDGSVKIVHEHCVTYYDEHGKPVRSIGTTQDITERKRLEGQLFRSQKLETVGTLAGGVAHEFNSILTVIVGQSEIMLSDLPPNDPLLNNIIEIQKAANRATTLTRQLLAYGRKQILQVETLDLNQAISNMEGAFRHLLNEEIELHITLFGEPLLVRGDAGQIEHVFMNMVLNARAAMTKGGRLTLATSSVIIDNRTGSSDPDLKPGHYAMISVMDSGLGMSEETKARVFEPFFSTKSPGEGMGLGLATCYGIIKQTGGHITVESQLALGTVFRIYLPTVERPTLMPPSLPQTSPPPQNTRTILIVEDDPALREMVAQLLKRLHYNVLTADNGRSAVNLIEKKGMDSIDLIFTDMMMPEMNGKELSEHVLARHPNSKILFTSGYTEALDANAAFLQKPFTPSALALKLREVLDR